MIYGKAACLRFSKCDPLWEKVPLRQNINFEIRVEIVECGPLGAYSVFYTVRTTAFQLPFRTRAMAVRRS